MPYNGNDSASPLYLFGRPDYCLQRTPGHRHSRIHDERGDNIAMVLLSRG